MTPDPGTEGGDGMWGQADKRSEQGKKQRSNTRNVRLAKLLSRIGITSLQQLPAGGRWSSVRGLGRQGVLAPLSLHYRT